MNAQSTARDDLAPIDHATRVTRVIDALGDSDRTRDAWLFTDLTDVRWLTGFVGSNGWAVVRADGVVVGTDGRYGDKARAETATSGASVVVEQQAAELRKRLVEHLSGRRVGLDAAEATHAVWQQLSAEVDLVHDDSVIKRMRMVKDDAEIARIERAAAITDAALAHLGDDLLGMTELDVRAELEYRMILLGADDRSYDTIVASGPDHAARPHHGASRRSIEEGDTVIIDVGALVDGYHSDMTRSRVIGEPTPQQREIYDLVARSQQAGLDAVAPGVAAKDIDAACRAVFTEAGYGDWYLHGTGHGVGLDIHEVPFHSQTSTDMIMPGHVVTVEPGLYRGGFGGLRIEDLVVVTETGHRVLSHSPKQT
jgi:Xaa-Pro aminopeptidase